MNWMYHHLRRVPRYRPVVATDVLQNRVQYPELEAFALPWRRLGKRVWNRLAGQRPYPPDLARLRRYQPRVLHSHFGYVGAGDLELQQALGVPWLVAFYGADVYLHERVEGLRERYALLFARARLVLALGPVMEEALAALGCPRDKIVVHPLGVDVDDVPHGERRLDRDRPLEILFAGTFREKKGAVYLLEAAGLLSRRGVPYRLHLVGDVSQRKGDAEARDEIVAAIGRFGLNGHLERHSWLEFKALMELALRCHVFVAPSVTARDGDAEGTPFVIQQMMLSAMPVISTRHSDIPYVFGPLAGTLAPERDAAALADRLTHYFENPDAIPEDGAAMRQRMVSAFDIRDCASHLATLYDRATA